MFTRGSAEIQHYFEDLLLAVSKHHSAEKIATAYEAGQRHFGENYLSEALEKQTLLAKSNNYRDIQWHFIGPIQSNKTRSIAENFDWVHSVDRLKIAQRLSAQRPVALKNLNLCLQVNIDEEESKSGVLSKDALELALEIEKLPRVNLRGLMCIPKSSVDFEQQSASFEKLRALQEGICEAGAFKKLGTLSMGMSNDLEAAIAQGATIVRIGTAIFGSRENPTTD
jgi:hypothetical protein